MRRFFTLVELLIVVSVIIILIGMLLPALGKARHTVNGIACMNNIKQLMFGYVSYSDSYDGWLLPGNITGLPTSAWFLYVYQTINDRIPSSVYAKESVEYKLFKCPSEIGLLGQDYATKPVFRYTHYILNAKLAGSSFGENSGTTFPTRRAPSVVFPSKAFILTDNGMRNGYRFYLAPNDSVAFRHGSNKAYYDDGYMRIYLGERTNVGYFDGHVSPLIRQSFVREVLFAGLNAEPAEL